MTSTYCPTISTSGTETLFSYVIDNRTSMYLTVMEFIMEKTNIDTKTKEVMSYKHASKKDTVFDINLNSV